MKQFCKAIAVIFKIGIFLTVSCILQKISVKIKGSIMFTLGELEDLSSVLVTSEEQIPFKVWNHIADSGLKSLQFRILLRTYIYAFTQIPGYFYKNVMLFSLQWKVEWESNCHLRPDPFADMWIIEWVMFRVQKLSEFFIYNDSQ